MPAAVRAASAGRDRPTRRSSPPTASWVYRPRGGQQMPGGHPRLDTAQLDRSGPGRRPHPRHQPGLVLAGDDGVGGRPDGQIPAHRGVQAEEAQRQSRVAGPGSIRPPAGPGAWPCASAPRTPPGRPSRRRLPSSVSTATSTQRTSWPAGEQGGGGGGQRAAAGDPARRWTPAERSHRAYAVPAPVSAPPVRLEPTATSRHASARRRAVSTRRRVGPRAKTNPR